RDSEGNQIRIVCNDAKLSAQEISDIYRNRWQIIQTFGLFAVARNNPHDSHGGLLFDFFSLSNDANPFTNAVLI
ncbi:hypothetical protein J2Z83_001279, partial [Virgibacillus natechei]